LTRAMQKIFQDRKLQRRKGCERIARGNVFSLSHPMGEGWGEGSPKQIFSRIEPMNFEMRTKRRSVTCSNEILHERDRLSGSSRLAKRLRVTDPRSDKESSRGKFFGLFPRRGFPLTLALSRRTGEGNNFRAFWKMRNHSPSENRQNSACEFGNIQRRKILLENSENTDPWSASRGLVQGICFAPSR